MTKDTKCQFWYNCDVIMMSLWRHNDTARLVGCHLMKIVDIDPSFFMYLSWLFRIWTFYIPYTIRTHFSLRKMHRMTNILDSSKFCWRQLFMTSFGIKFRQNLFSLKFQLISWKLRGQPSLSKLGFIFSNHFNKGGIFRMIRGKCADKYRKKAVIGDLSI